MTDRSHHTPNNPRGLRSVLIARFSALGDVAMTIPVVYSACRCYPDIRFTFLTRKSMTSIFVNPPANLTVVGVNLEQEYKGVAGLYRLYCEMRRTMDFDGFIDLHDVLRTKILGAICRLHGIPVAVINKGRRGKRALTRRYHKILLPLQSTRARYRQVFHKIGLPVESRFDGLFDSRPVAPESYAKICPPKKPGEVWIGIAPFAKHEGKIYPLNQMEEVVIALTKAPGVRLFFFGGGEREAQILNAWAEKYDGCISLAGKRYGFPTELSLVSCLDVMVSMDSANMHLASLVNTPVVSVWGATHPYCGFKGWRQREDDMVQLPMTCRPCSVFGNKPCYRGDYLCLRGIAPKLILDRIARHVPSIAKYI